jgi:UDP-N-acetylglucosamine acyltransferase
MHKLLYRDGLTLEQSKAGIKALVSEYPQAAIDVQMMLDFLNAPSAERGIVR